MEDQTNHTPDKSRLLNCTAETLKILANPQRLKILCSLAEHELTVLEIVERAGSSQSNVSQHLGQMRDRRILQARQVGNRVYYRITDARILAMINMLQQIYCEQTGEQIC